MHAPCIGVAVLHCGAICVLAQPSPQARPELPHSSISMQTSIYLCSMYCTLVCSDRTPSCVCLQQPALPLPRQHNVGSCCDAQLVDGIAPVPDAAGALHDGNDLVCDALRKAVLSTAHVPPLGRRRHDPLDGRPPPLPLPQRHRDLKRNTTARRASLTSNAQERCHRVNRQCQVEYGVERKV